MEDIAKMIQSLNEIVREIKTQIETLIAKDKQLDRGFKKDIGDVNQLIQDLAIKLYRYDEISTNIKNY